MKKLFFAIAALFVSFAAAAQNYDSEGRIIIDSKEEFLKIGSTYSSSASYIQKANIDLGDKGTMNTSIINVDFTGTYDGDGHTISYKATFAGTGHNSSNDIHNGGDYGLFRCVKGGTLKNMNINGEVLMTAAGSNNNMNVALLCGHTVSVGDRRAIVDHCNVVGSVSTYINAQNGGGADAALLIGQADGTTVQYCMGSGNVVGVGWVGGLIGSGGADPNNPVTVKACAFSGKVRALQPDPAGNDQAVAHGYGAGYAGGIIGYAGRHGSGAAGNTSPETVTIELCYVNADIYADNVATGVASVAMRSGAALVKNCCIDGSIVKTANRFGEQDNVSNSTRTENTHNATGATVGRLEEIVAALNGTRGDEKAEFDVVDGKIVFYLDGKPAEPCAAVTGLTISSVAPGSLTCSWTAGGSEAWIVSISGGGLTEDIRRENVTTNQDFQITDNRLTTSDSNYVLSVVAVCGDDRPNSPAATLSFVIPCPTIADMIVTTPDCISARVTWTNRETVKAELYKGENRIGEQTITSEQEPECDFLSLSPNTTYKVKLSAACGGDYGAPTERVFTTPSLPIVSGLTTAPSYDGTIPEVHQRGSVTVSWNVYTPALSANDDRYEVEIVKISSNSNIATAQITDTFYTKSQIDTGSYTVRVRVKYGTTYSDWTDEYPFVISNPNAPKNPTWTFLRNENNSYDVMVTWTKGNDWQIGNYNNKEYAQYWKVNSNHDSIFGVTGTDDYNYVFTSVAPGSDLPVSIVEYQATKTGEEWSVTNTSSPLSFTIPVPCFDISPSVSDITQTSATLNGLSEGDTVYLSGGEESYGIRAEGTSLSLTGLDPATHYTAEVRRYCDNVTKRYSSKTVEFTTVGCYRPTNITVTDITSTSATVSWTQGNPTSGLLFRYVLEEKTGETTYTQVQTADGYVAIAKTFTNLKPATLYRVSIAEQCGTAYGTPTTITFTTRPGNFVAINSDNWYNAATWQDGRIPYGGGTIVINDGVTVTLDKLFVLNENYTLINNGTLLINKGELVNTTDNNDLGNVRISFIADQDAWKFIGAPFTGSQDGKYRLESIEPVSGSDVAVVLYNYQSGVWSNNWATINDRVPQAEGFFAWPFYSGTITFNNDYNTDGTVDYTLNNSDITVTRDVVNSSGGNWMALANPYPAKLNIATFLTNNSSAGLTGGVVYSFNGSSFDVTNGTSGSLPVCEGFFVNFSGIGTKSVSFNKEQMTSYPTASEAKNKTAQNPWIEMSLVNKRDEVKFYFVQNPLAEQGYDKYDANKLFATTGVAEPYFVTDGMNLVKEEVRELPYYATLNVRSEQDTLMTFVARKIPEGYRVSLIDGEQTIEMNEGSRYTTDIVAGENTDRFKLLIQNNVGLNHVPQADITITNSNRHVAISAEAISKVEVFNALGQKVYETKASAFTLSSVQSGVYVVRVSTDKGTKSQKIVVE